MPDLTGTRVDHGTHWSACSIMGPGRERNADALMVDLGGDCIAFAVADGVGSLPASPIASTTAVNAVAEWLSRRRRLDYDDARALITHVSERVAVAMQQAAIEGATTLVAAGIADGRAVIASIGDSEALVVHDTGPAERLNRLDHMPTQPNVLMAWIDGEASFEPHVIALDALPLRFCLVTDGVAGTLNYDQIADIVRSVPIAEAAQALARAAREAGSRDDATALVFSNRVQEELPVGLRRVLRRPRRRVFGIAETKT